MKTAAAHIQRLITTHRAETILLLAVLAYTAVFTSATYQKHYTFSSYAWDLGVFNQLLHDTLFEGKPLYYTPDLYFNASGNYLVIHFSPILLLLLPLYVLIPGVTTLLFVKTLLLASAAIPLYLLANQHIKDKRISLAISLAYLLYPGLQGANWFDFQQQAFIPLLLFTALYLFTKEQWAPYAVTILLTFMVFELSFAIVIVSLLCLQMYTPTGEIIKQLKQPQSNKTHITILTSLFGVVYYYIAKSVMAGYTINPLFRQQYLASSVFNIIQYRGDTLLLPAYILTHIPDVMQALSYDPALKLLYIIFLFGPLLFLPITTRSIIPLLLLFSPFILSNYQAYYMIGSHYPLYIIVPTFVSLTLVYANHFHAERLHVAKKMLLVTALFALTLSPISPVSDAINAKTNILWYPPHTTVTDRVEELHTLASEVPQNASILTQNHIFPHFSDRINAYVLPTLPTSGDQETYLKNYIDGLMDESDYILLDLRTYDSATSYVFEKSLSPDSGHSIARYLDSAVLITKTQQTNTTIASSYPRLYTTNSGLHVGKGTTLQDPTSKFGQIAESTPGTREGHLVYGPYEFMDKGTYRITFTVKTEQPQEGILGTFDVYDSGDQITKRDVYGYEVKPGEWTNFTINLTLKQAKAAAEYRFEASDQTTIQFDCVYVEAQTRTLPESTRSIDSKDLNVADSRVTADKLIVATANGPQPIQTVWFGPYITLPRGNYTVTYHLKPTRLTQETPPTILYIDAATRGGRQSITGEWATTPNMTPIEGGWYTLTLNLQLTQETELEFRGSHLQPGWGITLSQIIINPV